MDIPVTDKTTSLSEFQCIKQLGIVVVYLVNKDDGGLLDLHLEKIEEHTHIPYTIYASTSRLLPHFIARLENHSNIKLCEYPATDLRGFKEHAYYLDRLVQSAIDDGVSHVALLNVDSFPIRTGWAEIMAEHLSDSCLVAAVKRVENLDNKPHPCGILLHRDFIVKYNARINLTDDELMSPHCQQYLKETSVISDTGAGYGYKLYAEGLSWYPLLRSNKAQDHYIISGIYGDLIYHLGGAARGKKIHLPERLQMESRMSNPLIRRAYEIVRFIRRMVPDRAQDRFSKYASYLLFPSAQKSLNASEDAYAQARKQLLESPDSYIQYLRTGCRSV